jgi:hypothetical protein
MNNLSAGLKRHVMMMMKSRCGAQAHHGGRCRAYPLPGKRRCRMHGGRLTGGYRGAPIEPMQRGRAIWLARLHAQGLRPPGGPRRKIGTVRTMVERAVAVIEGALVEVADAPPKPLEEMSAPELLRETARQGLLRLREIVSQPLDLQDLKQQRLVGDMAVATCRLFMRAAEGELQARRRDGDLSALMTRINADRAAEGKSRS